MNNGSQIYLSWREGLSRRKQSKIVDFKPHFYIRQDASKPKVYRLNKGVITYDLEYEDVEDTDLEGRPLTKVTYESSNHRYSLFNHKTNPAIPNITYEADVPLHFRYCVDELTHLKEYDMRKWYWDMEWQQGGEHHDEITTIVVYDNYDKQFYQWVWFPDSRINERIYDDYDNQQVTLFQFDSEKEMLESFIDTMIDKDPDMLIAWFGLKFDLPKLLERCEALQIDARAMSPIHEIKGFYVKNDEFIFKHKDGYSPISQPIGGRITLNLDLAFERQWNDSQRGTLPSLSLEYISQTLFGEGKVKHGKFEDPNEFYRRGWLEDTEIYLEYAVQDVELLRKIDETNFTSEAIIALQRLLIAPFDACFYASHMGSIYFMRNATWIAPTGDKSVERKDYEGAMIYNPLDEGTNGLHLGVAAFDYAGLYPSMMIARNISWETKSRNPTEFGVDILVPRNLQPLDDNHRPHMLYYNTEELGLLPRAVLELKELRNDYKAKMKYARENNTGEYQKWYNNQMAVKRLMASFYGIIAFQGFGWADVDLAASITASAREAIREAAFIARGL